MLRIQGDPCTDECVVVKRYHTKAGILRVGTFRWQGAVNCAGKSGIGKGCWQELSVGQSPAGLYTCCGAKALGNRIVTKSPNRDMNSQAPKHGASIDG